MVCMAHPTLIMFVACRVRHAHHEFILLRAVHIRIGIGFYAIKSRLFFVYHSSMIQSISL